MKRFVVFAGDYYYPSGGANDFQDAFDTLAEALAFARPRLGPLWDWAHVWDTQTGEKHAVNRT